MLRLETDSGIEEISVDPLQAPYFDLPMIDDFIEQPVGAACRCVTA